MSLFHRDVNLTEPPEAQQSPSIAIPLEFDLLNGSLLEGIRFSC